MKNNKTTIPDYIHRQCLTNCFLPVQGIGGTSSITLKDNDVIAAPIINN